MRVDYYASSPVLFMPPHQSSYFFPHHFGRDTNNNMMDFQQQGSAVFPPSYNSASHVDLRPSSFAAAGRKRSRDDMVEDEDDCDAALGRQNNSAVSIQNSKSQPIQRSMPDVCPCSPTVITIPALETISPADVQYESNPFSQSLNGSVSPMVSLSRPIAVSRKSQRLSKDMSPTCPLTTVAVTSSDRTGTVDRVSLILGVGWIKLDTADLAIQAAARGWARFIEKYFPELVNVEILLQSKSDSGGYLARAYSSTTNAECYCRFTDDLRTYRVLAVEPGVPAENFDTALNALRRPGGPLFLDQIHGNNQTFSNQTIDLKEQSDHSMPIAELGEPMEL